MNLPKTGFPMRAGLSKSEPKRLKDWQDNKVYEQVLKKNEGHKKFVLHDGPPYANGPIHIGHAMNKISKDMINRYWMMQGYEVPYVPGWDCHGQPIEHKVEEKLGTEKFNQTPTAKIRELCNEFAVENIELQKAGFRRLGVLGDWDNPYLTLYHQHDAADIEVFKAMFDKGMIYRGHKPVHWCKHCHTALAEAEIEYSDETSPSIFVRFEMTSKPAGLENFDGPVDFIIWTTTPWTIPSDQAVSLKPGAAYVAVEHDGRAEVMLEDLAPKCCEEFGWEYTPVMVDGKPYVVPAETFHHIHYKQPIFDGVEGVALLADYVGVDDGTGIVHNSPGHGVDDYFACLKEGITDICMPVDDDGKFYTGEEFGTGGPFSGMDTDEANPHIIEFLRERGTLVLEKKITHSYPHCWRCKQPIIFRATPQWFCSVDSFKEDAVAACENVRWLPVWGKERMAAMIRERADWCISRQRRWGLPIPVFYCDDCHKPVCTEESIEAVAQLFEREGSNAWFDRPAADILPEGFTCPHCGGKHFTQETDTLDGWFDSGSTHVAAMQRDQGFWPADMYIEGGDQYRGWFQSSLLVAVGALGKGAPYRECLTHGWTVDGEGRAMHKSLGNGMDPAEIINEFGADMLRLWAGSADYHADMRCSKEIFKQLTQNYLKFRNTARYCLGNLDGFDAAHLVAPEDMLPLDRWAITKLNDLIRRVAKAYDNYEFHVISHAINDFCVVELSSFYLDIIKDRLYCDERNGLERRSAQTALFLILDSMTKMFAPILAFTCDEIWQAMPHRAEDDARNVLLNVMNQPFDAYALSESELARWDQLIRVRSDVNGVLEAARAEKRIGKPLEAAVTLRADDDAAKAALDDVQSMNLPELLIVSQALIGGDVPADAVTGTGTNFPGLHISVRNAPGTKCPRCWMHSEQADPETGLCPRCAAVVAAQQAE